MAKSIKLSTETWKRIEQCAQKAGYSSPEELVENAIAKELARVEEDDGSAEVERRLKGLGYLE
jgi:predicted transcriptional regulator